MRSAIGWLGLFLAPLLVSTATASAQNADFSFSVGYGHLFGGHQDNGTFFSRDGFYVDSDFAWHIPAPQFPLEVGFGLAGSGYFDRHAGPYGYGGYDAYGYYYDNSLYSDFGNFEIEPRVGITLWSTDIRGLFVKPRLGAGLLIDNYSIDTATASDGVEYIYTHYHTGAAFELRPSVLAGYAWGPWSVGGELYYMPAWGDFGRIGNSLQELGVGAFFTLRF